MIATQNLVTFENAHDLELARRVTAFLAERNVPGLRRLYVRSRQGVVTLEGHVKTFYEKQLGGHAARRVAGVVRVIDAVEVEPAGADQREPSRPQVRDNTAAAKRADESAAGDWEGPLN